jgi:hypothetical protein
MAAGSPCTLFWPSATRSSKNAHRQCCDLLHITARPDRAWTRSRWRTGHLMIRHPDWFIVAVVALFPPWQSRRQEEPFDAKVHDDLDGSGARAGSDGPAGRRATAAVRSTQPPCAQERNSDHQKDKLRRNNRLLRVWPGLDQCVRSPLLQMRPLLASDMIVAGFCARPNFGIS